MKIFMYFLLFSQLLYVDNLYAQNSGVLSYKKTINDKLTPNPRIENYIIYFNEKKSLEIILPSNVNNSTIQTGANSEFKTVSLVGGKRKRFVYKDLDKRELILGDNIDFKYYLINDTLSNFDWVITNEHQKILKFNCTKALTNFRGRAYEAWFTDDVAIQNGPWKFGKLPGLIVKIKDSENIYNYELEGIDFRSQFDSKIISIPEAYRDDKIIEHYGFMILYDKKVQDLVRESKASIFIKGNISGSSSSSIPPRMEKY